MPFQSKDSSTTEAEAALFASKAAELMEKYNISVGVLTDKTKQEVKDIKSNCSGIIANWQLTLAYAACHMMSCRMYLTSRKLQHHSERTVYFYGLPQNVQACNMTYDYLFAAATQMYKGALREKRVKAAENRGYMNGISDRISYAVYELQEQIKKVASGESQALVRLTDQLLADFADNKLILVKGRAATKKPVSGYCEGFEDGARVDVHGANKKSDVGRLTCRIKILETRSRKYQ